MASRNSVWSVLHLPVLVLLLLAVLHSSTSTSNDYFVDIVRERPTPLSENAMRHIMQLVSLGSLGLSPPLSMRYREKSLKRARLSAPHPRHHEYTIGSEFLGKRSSPEEDKRMGSELLGKRMGSEFLGKRSFPEEDKRMGSEFLGKRSFPEEDKRMGSEFLGKRMGSEFLGKRMGSEFLGKRSFPEENKRIGSEFLGKRMGSEFLGKRSELDEDDVLDNVPYKRMGSEFLGKRSGDEDRQESEDISRKGSEFLGRKKRQAKTTDRRQTTRIGA